MFSSPYENLRERVFSRCRDVDNGKGCWEGIDQGCKGGYQRQDYWVPGLGGRVRLTTHLLAYVLHHNPDLHQIDEVYLAYWELRCSGWELDHTCDNTACRNPGHLEPKTHRENICDGRDRRLAAKTTPVVNYEPDPHEIEF